MTPIRAEWKSEDFGPTQPHVAMLLADGTHGVWVAEFDAEGSPRNLARPLGRGRGMNLHAAIGLAILCNMSLKMTEGN